LQARFEPLSGTVELAYPREAAPGPEALLDVLGALGDDARAHGARFLPWPDRSLRSGPADLRERE
ncbi:MAG: hypothetical protein ACREID_00545, partial [Planctomycetota bacterium]